MKRILENHTKSINKLYRFIDITGCYLKDLEKRISELEKSKEYDEYYKR